MVDVVTPEKRRQMMSGIQGKNTQPELVIRKNLYAMGFRYRIHDKRIPGKPDLVFTSRKAAIFIHGCFWHVHDCHLFKWPSSRVDFWKQKLSGNVQHDKEILAKLNDDGWHILTIWECALKGKNRLSIEEIMDKTVSWLNTSAENSEIRGKEDGAGRLDKY